MAKFVRDCLYRYWETENQVIDYLFLDIIIRIGYDNFEEFQTMIDGVGLNNQAVYVMMEYLQGKLSKSMFFSVNDGTYIHKLSYKNMSNNIMTKINLL